MNTSENNQKMKRTKYFLALVVVGVLSTALFSGCQTFSNNPEPGALTSVTITNQPVPAIAQATSIVFANHGFTGGQTGPNEFTYQRPGSPADNIAYASYAMNEAVTVRVVVNILPTSDTSTVVACKAWLVEAAGDPVLEDSHPVHDLGKRPYEDLLKEIKSQLGE
jgi:hypothetical protein